MRLGLSAKRLSGRGPWSQIDAARAATSRRCGHETVHESRAARTLALHPGTSSAFCGLMDWKLKEDEEEEEEEWVGGRKTVVVQGVPSLMMEVRLRKNRRKKRGRRQ